MQWPSQPRLSETREPETPYVPESPSPPPRRLIGELLGTSDQMCEVRALIDRVADTDVTVLIRGESGTGKELVARGVHDASPRRDRTFVKVNCAALPAELLESELFGFERGAFTGAIQHKPGKFEFANHGTMFLDEISEMSAPLQSKLLQVLQDGEFARLGGRQDVRVDVRVVAATTRTSTCTSCLPPSRANSPSCSTCRSLACSGKLMSPISSRNIVPWLANSNLPGLCWSAPVNAPRSKPNSSDSSSSVGSAAQFTLTNGMSRRSEEA